MINLAHPIVLLPTAAVLAGAVIVSVRSIDTTFERIGRSADSLARSSFRLIAIVFAIALALAILPSLIWGVPVPNVHDEFAYLLAGDTFSRGRLTNPPHVMAEFFETFHVIQSPTYASKFPIGQGVALAIGFVIGLPIAGVWLSTAAGCAAVAWAVRAIMPPRWALVAGLWCAIHPLTAWWSQSYWGGGVAMLGGAIFTGAALRAIRPGRRVRHGVLLGIGLAILANSRPLEGAILATLILAWMIWRSARTQSLWQLVARIALPAALVVAPALSFMAYYNWRVTGNAMTMPYLVHTKQYMTAPLMRWQSANLDQSHRHEVFRRFFGDNEVREYEQTRGWRGLRGTIAQRWSTIGHYLIEPWSMVLPLLGFGWAVMRRRSARWILAICLLLPTLHALLTPWFRITYIAPLYPLIFIAFAFGLREMLSWSWRGKSIGRALAVFVVIAQLLASIAWAKPLSDLGHDPLAVERSRLIRQLERDGGKHLVVVRYAADHNPLFDFVSNRADIDNSPVVFARSMGDEKNRALINHFHSRKVWDLYYEQNTPLRFTPR